MKKIIFRNENLLKKIIFEKLSSFWNKNTEKIIKNKMKKYKFKL